MTREFLLREYIENRKSLADLARECQCTRQYIHKRMKEYGIARRDLLDARRLAVVGGKLHFEKTLKSGERKNIIFRRHDFKEDFFAKWSERMAYVLGIIYTDGNLNTKNSLIKIDQKEPELLEKIKIIMNSDAPLRYRPRAVYNGIVQGELYTLVFSSQQSVLDLQKIGLTPRKSLTMDFPEMPIDCIRHFIRGCWDGDGSVFFTNGGKSIRAHFVSGSKNFVEKMTQHLERAGLKKPAIYVRSSTNPRYSFKVNATECEKLYHLLYYGVSQKYYLSRKHNIFEDFFGKIEKGNWNLNIEYL